MKRPQSLRDRLATMTREELRSALAATARGDETLRADRFARFDDDRAETHQILAENLDAILASDEHTPVKVEQELPPDAILAVDIGGATIRSLLGTATQSRAAILAHATVATALRDDSGFKHGRVVHREQAIATLRRALDAVAWRTGRLPEAAVVGIAPPFLKSYRQEITVDLRGRALTQNHLRRALSVPQPTLPSDVRPLHIFPSAFALDGFLQNTAPVGAKGRSLEIPTNVIAAPTETLDLLIDVFAANGLRVLAFVSHPYAAAFPIATTAERAAGLALLDIGATASTLALFAGETVDIATHRIGGRRVTTEVAIAFRIDGRSAQWLVEEIGPCPAPDASEDNTLYVRAIGRAVPQEVSRRKVADIIHDALEDYVGLFSWLGERIERHGLPLRSGIVLTGAAAGLYGMRELCERITGAPTRIGIPAALDGTPSLSLPGWASTIGLLLTPRFEAAPLQTRPISPRSSRVPRKKPRERL